MKPYVCRNYVNIATAKRGGVNITVKVFAKADGCNVDIFDRPVASSYKTSIAVWSQYKNRPDLQGDVCLPPSNTSSLLAESVKTEWKRRISVIKRSEDVSNPAFSIKHDPGFVCLANTNRTIKHKKRGGSVVCLESNDVAKRFRSILTAGPLGCSRRHL